MKSMTRSIEWRAVLALGLVCALIGAGSSAAAQTQTGALGKRSDQSGAGPGWPETLSPEDFVAQVDNPWFPLTRKRVRYKGFKEGTKMIDVFRVTAQDQDDPRRQDDRGPRRRPESTAGPRR